MHSPILLLGDINTDLTLKMPYYPHLGEDGLADEVYHHTGGSAVNTAIVLAHLGQPTQLIAAAGTDHWSKSALDSLASEGIDLRYVQAFPGMSVGMNILAVTPDGERTMLTHRGANPHLAPDPIQPSTFDCAQLLHLSGYALLQAPQSAAAQKALQLARERQIPVTLDLGMAAAQTLGERLFKVIEGLEWVVMGEQEIASLMGEGQTEAMLDRLLSANVKHIGLKLGKRGCRIITPHDTLEIPGFPVTPIDTTGAGDAFSAGLIYGCVNHLSLTAAGLLANVLGALATTTWGAGETLPSKEQAVRLITQHTARPSPYSKEIQEILASFEAS